MKKKETIIHEDKAHCCFIRPKSAVQGGSNFGQGSSQLGKKSYTQGRTANTGSNYDNEQGWNNEALRLDDLYHS